MSHWKEYKLGDVCKKIGSGATPRGGGDSYHDSGEYALIRSQNVLDFVFSMQGLAYINDEQASKLKNVELEKRDILLNITGDSVARVCQVPAEFLPARVNQHVAIIRPDNKFLSNEYLKYYLLNPKFKEYMLMLSSSGATRNAITKGMIENFVIQAPEIHTQNSIAEILSSLDDKIELNNQIIQELEALAQALFKQWFIDFEFPNENGRPHKSSGGEMIESELGEIPRGWKVLELGDVSNLYAGGDKPKAVSPIPTEEHRVPIYSNGISDEGLYGYTDVAKIFEESITVSARGTIGYVCLRTQPYVPIVRLITVIPNPKVLSCKYLYMWLKNQNIEGNGTTQQQLTVPDFKTMKILVPEIDLTNQFALVMNSIYENILSEKSESKELANLRDTLLPKLISGELEVSEVLTEVAI